jgi:uncharacterized repeat protein (TIGR01451 family)
VQQGQLTRADGFYKFDLNFSSPACPSGHAYLIAITPPGAGYTAGYSQLIPPTSGATTAPLSVPTCPGGLDDAVPATDRCEAQASEAPPAVSVPARSAGTKYHVHLLLDDTRSPATSQIFNNHIPLDPVLNGVVGISKTTPLVNVSRGQLIPYDITVTNQLAAPLTDVTVVDRIPAGFHYVDGSAEIDGVPSPPVVAGLELSWAGLTVPGAGHLRLRLVLSVGAGVNEGEYRNRAWAVNGLTGTMLTGEAHATVRVIPDPSFDCTDVIGKVFDDANRNGAQDGTERGLPGVRLVTTRGLVVTTDAFGRFHISCAITPDERRGSNFVLKLDDRTLPSGYRLSGRQTQVKRATRGKALKFDFSASIFRVVALDLADPVFQPASIEMRPQWQPRIALLLEELKKAPATLRLSYVADVEDPDLVERRVAAVEAQIRAAWEALAWNYELTIERQVFWRRGGPPEVPAAAAGTGR